MQNEDTSLSALSLGQMIWKLPILLVQTKVSNNSERKEIKKNLQLSSALLRLTSKNPPFKKSLISQEFELSSSNIKNFLSLILKISYIFSKESFYFWEMETPKKFLCFSKRNFLIIQEKKPSYILEKVYSESLHI